MANKKIQGPKVLFLDIETKPILAHVWSLWENNVGLNQIESDWSVLSISANWLHEPDALANVMYRDNRASADLENDKALLEWAWDLLDEADIVVTQNGKRFDIPKLFARMVIQRVRGGKPPRSFRQIDTKEIASKRFGFTSNKLEYMTDKLCVRWKKLKHKKFPGHELWVECMKNNQDAWREMEKYNKVDVLSLRELWVKIRAWDGSINFRLYDDKISSECGLCGGKMRQNGKRYVTGVGVFQRYRCGKCGAEERSRSTLVDSLKNASVRGKVCR